MSHSARCGTVKKAIWCELDWKLAVGPIRLAKAFQSKWSTVSSIDCLRGKIDFSKKDSVWECMCRFGFDAWRTENDYHSCCWWWLIRKERQADWPSITLADITGRIIREPKEWRKRMTGHTCLRVPEIGLTASIRGCMGAPRHNHSAYCFHRVTLVTTMCLAKWSQ